MLYPIQFIKQDAKLNFHAPNFLLFVLNSYVKNSTFPCFVTRTGLQQFNVLYAVALSPCTAEVSASTNWTCDNNHFNGRGSFIHGHLGACVYVLTVALVVPTFGSPCITDLSLMVLIPVPNVHLRKQHLFLYDKII